jgi:hypothetical protein
MHIINDVLIRMDEIVAECKSVRRTMDQLDILASHS